MGRNYYLCKGYNVEDYYNPQLTKVFDELKSLESIDKFTSMFTSMFDLKEYLYNRGLIKKDEDLVIANNKTDKKTNQKMLVPIFQKKLIFKSDLELLGINGNDYNFLVSKLWEYVKKHQNDKDFMLHIIDEYINKYETKNDNRSKRMEAPIYRLGDISTLKRIINTNEKTMRDKNEYEFSFTNFFRNELYKCERIKIKKSFDGKDLEEVTIFKPINNSVNTKGLHDMLVNIINYENNLKINKDLDYIEEETEYDDEYFLEERDYDRILNEYADNIGLDLNNEEEVKKNDYALSLIIDREKISKKIRGCHEMK